MEKKDVRREDVIEALKEIAFGRVNRTVEVKFVDRVKALSALYDMLGGGDADEAAEFLQALEQAGEEKDDWRP